MGFVVKITAHAASPPRWIGFNSDFGNRSVVAREEARVFDSEMDAIFEIEAFQQFLPHGAKFEIEDE